MGIDQLMAQYGPLGLMVGGLAWAYLHERETTKKLYEMLIQRQEQELKEAIEREMATIENLRQILTLLEELKGKS